MKESGLSNPAVASFIASPQGQKMIEKTQDNQQKAINTGLTILKFLIVSGVLTIAYFKIFRGFKKLDDDKRYRPSNISTTQAKARAEAIYTALLGIGANFKAVENNLTGLNHNGFIKVFNEFGERRSATLTKMNLVEWLQDQFGETEIAKLRFLIKGFF